MRPFKSENADKVKSEVFPDDGTNGIEFFIALTLQQFTRAYAEQGWTQKARYEQLTKVLGGNMRTTWEEILRSQYWCDERRRTGNNRNEAMDQLISKFLNCKKPHDVQAVIVGGGV